jgi:D-sedoheptulose 7-phosphate isomerase
MDPSELRACMRASLTEGLRALEDFLSHEPNISAMASMSAALAACFAAGNKVLACGNGGSACDALHFAEEFTGRFRKERRPLPVIPLMEAGHLTCVANDYGWDEVFARGVEAYGKPGDILLLLSTSGNSPNVVKAAAAARRLGLQTLSLLGKTGGSLKGQGDIEIVVPGRNSDRIQEIHMQVLHILIEGVEREMFPENYADAEPADGRGDTDGRPQADPHSEQRPQDWAPLTATKRASRRLGK